VYGTIQVLMLFQGTLNSWWTRIVIGFLVFVFCGLQRLFERERARRSYTAFLESRLRPQEVLQAAGRCVPPARSRRAESSASATPLDRHELDARRRLGMPCVSGGQECAGKPESSGFGEPHSGLRHAAHFASEPNFTRMMVLASSGFSRKLEARARRRPGPRPGRPATGRRPR